MCVEQNEKWQSSFGRGIFFTLWSLTQIGDSSNLAMVQNHKPKNFHRKTFNSEEAPFHLLPK